MQKTTKLFVIALIIIVAAIYGFNYDSNNTESIKIGVISDFTGPAAYWGESTKVGVNMAIKELRAEGKNIEIIYEDYKLETVQAATAAQKLLNVDKVSAVYTEFNPGAIAVNSVLKDTNTIHMYNAAVASPLDENPNAYKTYLDYKEGCKMVAQEFKNSGVEKIGVLKMNLEFAELCVAGVKEIYGDDTIVESYNLGDTDFRTQLLKINSEKVGAVINTGFEGETFNTLKVMRDLGYTFKFGTVEDTITEKVRANFSKQLIGTFSFGFGKVSPEFIEKVTAENDGVPVADNHAAAEGYTHIKQIAKALDVCATEDMQCIRDSINASEPDTTFGFKKFNGRIADIGMVVYRY